MRICRKCSKQVTDDSKICRDCGAILEGIPDDSVPVAATQPEPSVESRLPVAAEWQAAEPSTGNKQSVGEDVMESEEPAPSNAEALPWKCPQCGEAVPGTFDGCWKCLTTKDGGKADQGEPVFCQEDPDASRPDEKPEPIGLFTEAEELEENERQPQSACPRCGSARMMFGVTIRNRGEVDTTLQVVICGDPSALIFKDRLYGELRANICGDCGHVELRVTNPKELYRHYRKSSG